jgi:uncharacterized surface protein with fasciclin (FAS1) repeats
MRPKQLLLVLAGTLLTTTTTMTGAQMATAHAVTLEKTIVDVAVENGNFTVLVKALKAADLVGALQGKGPFTVFAPTDEAFAKLPKGTLDALLKDPQKLASILTYHVVSGKVMAADVVKSNGAKPTTLNGGLLDIQVKNGKVWVNGAMVTAAGEVTESRVG